MESIREISERTPPNLHGVWLSIGLFVLVLGFVPRAWAQDVDEVTDYLMFVAGEVPPDVRPEPPPPPPVVKPKPCLDCQPRPTQPAPRPGIPIPRPPNPTQG